MTCQVIVNMSAPHLFKPFTPGVLSLLGLAILTEPWWGRPFRSRDRAVRRFTKTFVAVIVLSVLTESLQGPSDWMRRVAYDSFPVWVNHSVFTGLYPFFPWIVFACFGMTVARLSMSQRRTFFRNITAIGMATSVAVLVQSQLTDQPWALPTGEASLTFFPANAPFLIAAMTGVAMLWWVAERVESTIVALSHAGRASLTVYVLHFIPFALFHESDTVHGWSATLTGAVVVAYTTGWIVLGTWLARRVPHLTIESWMKRREPS